MPVLDFTKLKGLTANDRSESDKKYLDTIQGNSISPTINTTSQQSTQPAQIFPDTIEGELGALAAAQGSYEDTLKKYQEQYRVGKNDGIKRSTTDIQEIASKVSPHYKKYQLDSDKLTLTNEDWAKIHASYDAIKDTYGEDQANSYLYNAIKDNVASNQPWYEQAWNGFKGMGASAAGAMVGLAGNAKGIYDYFAGNHEDVEGLGAWDNFLDSVIDNEITRYGTDIVQYGVIRPESIEKAKSYGTEFDPTGLSELDIMQTREQEESLFSSATPWLALQSGGFTLASMAYGGAAAKAAGWLFGGLSRGAIWANKASQTSNIVANTIGRSVKTAEKLGNTLEKIKKGENKVDRFVIPGAVGSMEGAMEGLQTKIEVEKSGIQSATDAYKKALDAEVEKRLEENYHKKQVQTPGSELPSIIYVDDRGNQVDVNEVYKEVQAELEPKFNEALAQVNYAATRAGINNFYINSFINGAINSTIKAGLQADRVQNALRNGKLTGWAFNKPKFNISGTPGNATVTANTGSKIWALAKEPIGEMSEEYLQTISNDANVGAAENNIHDFIENKFNGDGTAAVGDWFGSDWAAAWSALTNSAVSKEAGQAAIMGALSSIMGIPALPGGRRVINPATGEIQKQGSFNITNLARGVNERGEKESTWEYLQRITPWRSGMYSNYHNFLRDKDKDEEDAKALTDWLNDPDNRDKFDDLVGAINWAIEMGKAAKSNDEFGYRNSTLGKTINDAIMLSKIADSNLGQSIMTQLEEISDLVEGSSEAQNYIKHMRDNVNVDTEGKSDSEILEDLQKNAKKMRTTLSTINNESKKIDRLIGNVDDDTRNSLIYSQMMLDDWKKRLPQLEEEINAIKIGISTGLSGSTYSGKEKKLIAKHGSLKAAISNMHRLNEERINLEKQIQEIEKLGDDATQSERAALRIAKGRIKNIGKQLKDYDSLSEDAQDRIVLNEEEIMNLDVATRGRMLRLGAQRLYTSLHEDKEAVDRLNSQIDSLIGQRDNLKGKTTRGKKANRNKAKRIKELNGQINQLRRELKEHKGETRQFYSDEQQIVIDNLVQQGMAQDANFLDKVVDAGRIQSAIDNFYAERQAILTDPRAYQTYVRYAKMNAQKDRVKKRAEHIGGIKNYNEFADEMDRVFSNTSQYEKDIITRTLRDSGNENWTKYKSKREYAEKLVSQLTNDELSSSLTANDMDLFIHTLNYLQNKDIDLNNLDQVISTLLETNDEGYYLFRDYIERMNDAHPEATKTVFTSMGTIIQTYKDVLEAKNKQDAEDERINREVPVVPTSPSDNNPPAPGPIPTDPEENPVEKPEEKTKRTSIWDIAYSSPDQGHIDNEGNRLGEPRPFEIVGNKEVADMAAVAIDIIKSSSYSDEIKEEAIKQLMTLSNPDVYNFDSVEDLISAIKSLSNSIMATADDTNINKYISQLLDIVSNALTRQNVRGETSTTTGTGIEDNATVTTINIEDIRKKHPDSWIVKFYDEYHIDDYIRDHIFNINTNIYFLTDSALTTLCINQMGDRYKNSDKPIIAAVEDENGPIEVDGKRYQPIGIMPSTGAHTRGSNRMSSIREKSSNDEGIHVVRNTDGSRVHTRATGNKGAVEAYHPDRNRDNSKENNKSVHQLIIETLPVEEQQRLNAMSHADRIHDSMYINASKQFISRLFVAVGNDGNPALWYKHDNLKDSGGSSSIILRKSINETIGVNGLTIQQALQSNNPNDLIEFNSRTSKVYSTLKYIYDKMPDLNAESNPDEFQTTIEMIEGRLNDRIPSAINLGKLGYKFKVVFDVERAINTGEIYFNISLESTKEGVSLIQFEPISTKSNIEEYGKNFISTLLSDGTNIRSFLRWQVNYGDVKILRGEQKGDPDKASKEMQMVVNDGFLDIAANSLQYNPTVIKMESPFDNDGNPRKFPEISNPDNATTNEASAKPTVARTTTTTNNATVDVNTGSPVDGNPNQHTNRALENAKAVSKAIVKDSAKIVLSDDGKYYELLESEPIEGQEKPRVLKRFARVTTLIEADEYGEEFPSDSPYITPSTNIGTAVDTVFRDFFAGELKKEYPNMDKTQLDELVSQMKLFKNNLDAMGITIVSNDVTVTGSVTVTDDKGQTHKVPVAGTLDLFGYDANGNFFIFDMKTIHDCNSSKIANRKPKWERQVSLYKDLLEQSYGIKVSEDNLKVIAISVKYPEPRSEKYPNGAVYELENDKSVQLNITEKGKSKAKFKSAKPKMWKTTYDDQVKLNYTRLNIKWDKLKDHIKTLISNEINGGNPVSIQSGSTMERKEFEDPDLALLEAAAEGLTELAPPPLPTDDKYDYSKFTSEQKRMLREMGVRNSKDWNNRTTDEMDHYIDCLSTK